MLLPVLPDLVANKIALGLGIAPYTEIVKKAWLFAKLQPGSPGKRFNAT